MLAETIAIFTAFTPIMIFVLVWLAILALVVFGVFKLIEWLYDL